MATTSKKSDFFNDFLDRNNAINTTSDLKDLIKKHKKGHMLSLLSALLIGSFTTLILSFAASIIGYGNPASYLICALFTNFIAILLNNMIFVYFLKRVRNETMNAIDITSFVAKFIPQVCCAIILTIAQTMISTLLLQVTAIIPTLNVVVSILIATVFTMLNAMVAFRIYDNKTKIRDILPGAFQVMKKNWKALLFIAILFITWSYLSNVAFSSLLYSQLQQSQGVNNIFHSLLQQQDYSNLASVAGFYSVNYLVAGFLEINMLLAVAIVYHRDRKVCFNEK